MRTLDPTPSMLAGERHAAERRVNLASIDAITKAERQNYRDAKQAELDSFLTAHGGSVSALSERDYQIARRLLLEASS